MAETDELRRLLSLCQPVCRTRSGSRRAGISRDLKMWNLASLANFRGLRVTLIGRIERAVGQVGI